MKFYFQLYFKIKMPGSIGTTCFRMLVQALFFLFFPENGIWHFMQVVSTGDISKPVFRENK